MKRIIFMGTPQFARTVLEGILSQGQYEVAAVVTQPDRPVGRKRILTPSPVKLLALDKEIPVYQPEKLSGSPEMDQLIALGADLIVTAAYGQFVPTKLLKAPPYTAINVHASLLPKYRGGAPIHYAIWKGEQETGVSIMYMEKEMDAGAILAQESTPIGFEENVGDLFERLAFVGRDLLLKTLPDLFEGRVKAQDQDLTRVTFSPTIQKEEEKLNWSQSALEIHNHVRAFNPFPSTYTLLNGDRLKIWKGIPLNEQGQGQAPGTILGLKGGYLAVVCGDNQLYGVEVLQFVGKKPVRIEELANGQKIEELINQQLG